MWLANFGGQNDQTYDSSCYGPKRSECARICPTCAPRRLCTDGWRNRPLPSRNKCSTRSVCRPGPRCTYDHKPRKRATAANLSSTAHLCGPLRTAGSLCSSTSCTCSNVRLRSRLFGPQRTLQRRMGASPKLCATTSNAAPASAALYASTRGLRTTTPASWYDPNQFLYWRHHLWSGIPDRSNL
jgi:hypothetical protein